MSGKQPSVLILAALVLAVLASLALAAQSVSEAVAARPLTKTPQPTGTPTPGGGGLVETLLFKCSGDGFTWSMHADSSAAASHALHGEHRWCLLPLHIGQDTYPHGSPRMELVALRDDAEDPAGCEGFTVQLTDDPALQVAWDWLG